MPRPRILCTPRSETRNMDRSEDRERAIKVAKSNDNEEPDCEIIKIEEEDETKERSRLERVAERIPYRRSSRNLVAATIPTMFSLRVLPDTSSRTGDNVYDGQKVMMVAPQSQVFNPTLYTLKKIENPLEISKIKRLVDMEQSVHWPVKKCHDIHVNSKQRSNETRDNVNQRFFVHNSAEKMRKTRENDISRVGSETLDKNESVEIIAENENKDRAPRELNTSASTLRDINSSVFETDSNISESIDRSSKSFESIDSQDSILKSKNSDEGNNNRGRQRSKRTSSERFVFQSIDSPNSKTTPDKSKNLRNNTKRQKPRISSIETLIDNVSLLVDEEIGIATPINTSSRVKNMEKQKKSISLDKKQADSSNPSITHENSTDITVKASNIVKKGEKSKISRAMETKTRGEKRLPKIHCIICKKEFTDPTELHKHATLEHSNVQILFCEHCSDSFFTHRELGAHRDHNCKFKATKIRDDADIYETIVIEDEDDTPESRDESRKKREKKKIVDRVDSSGSNEKTRRIKKKIAASNNSERYRGSSSSFSTNESVKLRKNFIETPKIHKYVEEDVMNHVALSTRKELVKAEIKKLIVPLTKLEDSTIERYLKKRVTKPKIRIHREDNENKGYNFRDSSRRREWRANNYNCIGNLKRIQSIPKKLTNDRRSMKKKMTENSYFTRDNKILTRNSAKSLIRDETSFPAKRNLRKDKNFDSDDESDVIDKKKSKIIDLKKRKLPTDSDSDDDSSVELNSKICTRKLKYSEVKQAIGIEGHDLTNKEQPVIRKLTSRSSAANVVTLRNVSKTFVTLGERKSTRKTNVKSCLKGNTSISCSTKGNQSIKLSKREETDSDSFNDSTIEEFDPEEFEEMPEDDKSLDLETEEKKEQRNKLNSSKEKQSRKTYLPSKKRALKRQTNETIYDLCFMCKELFALMKQLSIHFVNDKAKRISAKCPFCNLYFISMFYLEEHVATYHLHCRSQRHCKLARSSLLAKSLNSQVAIDCETVVELDFECQQCFAKFNEEKDYNDHIFKQHGLPNFCEDSDNETTPSYLNDLPKSHFQTFQRTSREEIFESENNCNNLTKGISLDSSFNEKRRKKWKYSFLNCCICDTNFRNRKDYLIHLRKIHNSLSSMFSIVEESERDSNLSRNEPESQRSQEIPIALELNTANRNILLKQLLSDDVEDKEARSEKKELSNLSKCEICCEKFVKIQDLLIHGLVHDTNVLETIDDTSKLTRIETNNLFVDSLDDNWNESIDSSTIIKKFNATPTISQPIDNNLMPNDDIFGNIEENEDPLTNQTTEESKIEDTESESTKTRYSARKSSPISEKMDEGSTSIVEKSEKIQEPRSEKIKAFEELLETEKGLSNKVTSEKSKLPIECNKCDRKFPNQGSLNEHLFFLHDDTLKDTVLTDIVSLSNSRSGEDNKSDQKYWNCKKCTQKFKLLQSYSRHRYFVHGDDEMVHICDNCCKVMSTVTMVNVHICTDVASYNCRACNAKFPTGISLRLHNMEKHMETEGPHFCKPCNKRFLTNAMLKRHEKWKHRLFRPYRPRKNSPVRMAIVDEITRKFNDNKEDNEMDSGCDQEYFDMEYEFTSGDAKKRDGTRDTKEILKKECKKIEDSRDISLDNQRSIIYIKENEILQCNNCQLYCLTKAALDIHKNKSHGTMDEICRLCDKMYSKGLFVRHMIDRHLNPDDDYKEDEESIWNIDKSIEDKDAEELVKILGIKRLISLCEYEIYSESTDNSSVTCLTCEKVFQTSDIYKYHFFMNHDVVCALCNIEFKSGDKAATHKVEEHGSTDCYIWFADKIVKTLNSATNFYDIVEQSFIQMISRESDESSNESQRSNVDSLENDDEMENSKKMESYAEGKEKVIENTWNAENSVDFSRDSDEDNDEDKVIIVVTEEDLEKYGIGTKNSNIWALASKISSTSNVLTPKDVKEMLVMYFER